MVETITCPSCTQENPEDASICTKCEHELKPSSAPPLQQHRQGASHERREVNTGVSTFENPANGHREEVGAGASLGVFFFGPVYLIIKGLWRHVFLWLVIVAPFAIMTGGRGIILGVPLACLIYAFSIQEILRNGYLRRGWKDITKKPVMVLDPNSGGYVEVPSAPSKPTTKNCPFCAEEIKAEAIKCKHCQSDLTAVVEG